jgi:hypothetical protein
VRAARTTEGGWPLTAAEPFTCKVSTHASVPPARVLRVPPVSTQSTSGEYSRLGPPP